MDTQRTEPPRGPQKHFLKKGGITGKIDYNLNMNLIRIDYYINVKFSYFIFSIAVALRKCILSIYKRIRCLQFIFKIFKTKIINRQIYIWDDKTNGTEHKQLVNLGKGYLGVPSTILITFL